MKKIDNKIIKIGTIVFVHYCACKFNTSLTRKELIDKLFNEI